MSEISSRRRRNFSNKTFTPSFNTDTIKGILNGNAKIIMEKASFAGDQIMSGVKEGVLDVVAKFSSLRIGLRSKI